jgi:serine protease Do
MEFDMRKLLLFMLAYFIAPHASAFDQQTLLKVFFNIVQVHTVNNDGSGDGFGSGIVVADDRALTNCHVLRKAKSASISQGEDSFGVRGMQIDAHHDLCMLVTDRLPLKPAEIGSVRELQNGMEVFAIGHSSGVLAPTTSVGQIKALYPYEDSKIIRSSARFAMGASGSGLFDDQGRLVGINTFKSFGKVAHFYAMPADWIAKLKSAPVEPVAPFSKTAFWENEENRPFFLQTAMPELQEKWSELLLLSQRWIAAEPYNAEAWYELGLAQENLNMLEASQQSYQKTTELNPHHADALFRLGMIAIHRGDQSGIQHIAAALAGINSEMATEFSKAAGCPSTC